MTIKLCYELVIWDWRPLFLSNVFLIQSGTLCFGGNTLSFVTGLSKIPEEARETVNLQALVSHSEVSNRGHQTLGRSWSYSLATTCSTLYWYLSSLIPGGDVLKNNADLHTLFFLNKISRFFFNIHSHAWITQSLLWFWRYPPTVKR